MTASVDIVLLSTATTDAMPGGTALVDVSVTLIVAVVFGMLARRVHLSAVTGYLLAGVVLGPLAIGVNGDDPTISTLAQIGVALLLFAIGLELPLSTFRATAGRPFVGGIVQVVLTGGVGIGALLVYGMDSVAAVAIGLAAALSSTAVAMGLLAERAESDSLHGRAALGVLLAQDLATVVFLIVVPELSGGVSTAHLVRDLSMSLAKLAAFVLVTWLVERVVMRRVFAGSGARDPLVVASIAVALGSIAVAQPLGLSPALCGFLAGLLMAGAPYSDRVRSEIAPLRICLLALFFAWVGSLADLTMSAHDVALVVVASVVLLVGKLVLAVFALRIVGMPMATSLRAAGVLANLGELGLALVGTAVLAGSVPQHDFGLFATAALVSLLLTPIVSSLAVRMADDSLGDASSPERRRGSPRRHVIVVGGGPAGRRVIDMLLDHGQRVTLVELNAASTGAGDTRPRVRLVNGDASRVEILEHAGLLDARLMVVTVPEHSAARRIVAQARNIAPSLPIVVRGRYNRHLTELVEAGSSVVVDEESVTGRELAAQARWILDTRSDDAAL